MYIPFKALFKKLFSKNTTNEEREAWAARMKARHDRAWRRNCCCCGRPLGDEIAEEWNIYPPDWTLEFCNTCSKNQKACENAMHEMLDAYWKKFYSPEEINKRETYWREQGYTEEQILQTRRSI